MFCPFCGHQNRDGKKFCRQCGRTLPAPRTNVGTSPLPHYNSFAGDLNSVADSIPNSQTDNQNQSVAPSLIDQSLYNSFSPSVEKLPNTSQPTTPQWQPALDPSSGERYKEDLEDQLNEFTQQLLPDTVGFEVPKTMPPLKGNGENGHSKPSLLESKESNSFGVKPQVSSLSSSGLDLKKGSSPTKLSSSSGYAVKPASAAPKVEFDDYDDDYAPTDEMEVLVDKSWEKTEDIPVLTEKTADMPVLTEKTQDIPILENKDKTQDIPIKPSFSSTSAVAPVPNIVKPVIPKQETPKNTTGKSITTTNNLSNVPSSNIFSVTSPQTATILEDSRRTERVILIILSLIALIGVSILVWVLILRPLGII
ncbi:MAG: zinc ribbon domain-containing protein [Acidobacteria bacterium]|nr:zinc ribbon domain-containing protein [Acidobacteriota bacterium]